jgi:phi13 family phage major tail protein
MAKVGVKNFKVAKVLTDNSSEFTTDTVYGFSNDLIKIDIKANKVEETLSADNAVQEQYSETSSYNIDINLRDLTPDEISMLLGEDDIGNLNMGTGGNQAPYWAVMFETTHTLASGAEETRYHKYFKGKFSEPDESAETKKEGSVNYQTPVLSGKFIKRTYTGDSGGVAPFKVSISDQDSGYSASIGSGWYNTGGLGTLDATAPTISSTVPADGASSVAVDSTVVWNFDKSIVPTTITSANFFVFKESDDSIVAGALSYDSDYDEITFTPTSNLDNSAEYKAVATTNIKSLAGTALAAISVITFTTTA